MKSILQNKTYLYLTCLFLGIITSFSLPPYNFVFLNFLSLPTLLYILINYDHKKIISFLDNEKIAYDIESYRKTEKGFRIWTGPTILKKDLIRLTNWLDWTFDNIK